MIVFIFAFVSASLLSTADIDDEEVADPDNVEFIVVAVVVLVDCNNLVIELNNSTTLVPNIIGEFKFVT